MGRDQDDIAARVQWHGAGLRVGRSASAAKISALLHRVLDERSFREAAERLRKAIQIDLTADRAVEELEALAIVSDSR
jgi:UDP:flavonoid glycosyltransferase YjiC (YdhE family)